MKYSISKVAQTAGLLALSGVALADTELGGLLDEVVVVANRTAEPLSSVGSSVTAIDTAAIVESQKVIVADLLATTAGITFARTGGPGSATSLFIRGAASDQTVVVIDGVVLNDPSQPGGGYDFQNLMMGDIARIEVLRGAQSTLYGSQAMGGVVNIVTAAPNSEFAGGVSAEGGSHDSGYFNGELGGKRDGLMWRVAANYFGTSGIVDFDPQYGGKRLCAAQVASGSGQVRYEFTPQVELDLRGYYVSSRKDFDGYDTPTFGLGDDSEYGKNQQLLGYAGLTERSASALFTNRFAVQYTHSNTRNFDPQAPANYGSTTTETYYGIGSNTREEYQGIWQVSPTAHLTYGAQHEKSEIQTDTPAFDLVPTPLLADATIDSAYAQWQGEVARGLTLTAGERFDHHSVYGGHSTGQLAVAWALNDKQTMLRASVSQGFKAPSLYQLFSNYGNDALKPEQSVSWDAGIEQHLMQGRLMVSATYFQSRSHDLIDFFDCSTPSPLCVTEPYGYYANIAATTAKGIELQTLWSISDQNVMSANYTYTDARNDAAGTGTFGNALARRPKQAANLSDSYHWSPTLSATVALRYAGRSYDDAANTIVLGGYVLADIRVSYAVSKSVDFYARIENVTDKHYETAYQYGTPGRVGALGVHASF